MLFEQIKQLAYTSTQQEPPVNNLNYPDPMKRMQNSRPERENIINNTALFPSDNTNLRTVDGQPVCNRCKKVRFSKGVL